MTKFQENVLVAMVALAVLVAVFVPQSQWIWVDILLAVGILGWRWQISVPANRKPAYVSNKALDISKDIWILKQNAWGGGVSNCVFLELECVFDPDKKDRLIVLDDHPHFEKFRKLRLGWQVEFSFCPEKVKEDLSDEVSSYLEIFREYPPGSYDSSKRRVEPGSATVH